MDATAPFLRVDVYTKFTGGGRSNYATTQTLHEPRRRTPAPREAPPRVRQPYRLRDPRRPATPCSNEDISHENSHRTN
jgi:hypothetical protein